MQINQQQQLKRLVDGLLVLVTTPTAVVAVFCCGAQVATGVGRAIANGTSIGVTLMLPLVGFIIIRVNSSSSSSRASAGGEALGGEGSSLTIIVMEHVCSSF